MFDVEIDNTTILLLAILLALLAYLRLFSRPEPLVHPLLLGKQSEVSNIRQEGETGIYRSWATGQGTPLSVRPASTLKTVKDVVLGPRMGPKVVQRCILDTPLTDEVLAEILRLIPLGLASLFPLSESTSAPTPILALLPASPSTSFPLLFLQLASSPATPLVVLPSPKFLNEALHSKLHAQPKLVVVHASIAEDVVEQVWEDCGHEVGILIVGDPAKDHHQVVADASKKGMIVKYWEEVWEGAEKSKKVMPDAQPQDAHSYFYSVNSTSSSTVVKVTHQNITAGIAGILSSYPADKRPSAGLKDVVATSVSLSTPLGMSIAMAAVWTGAGLRMIGDPVPSWDDSEENVEEDLTYLMSNRGQPAPTVLFLSPKQHQVILQSLHKAFLKLPFSSLIARHKINHITSGYISRGDRVEAYGMGRFRDRVLSGIVGSKARAITIVGDTPPHNTLAMSHLLLGMPVSRLQPSALSTGPIFVSHFYDLQTPSIPDPKVPLDFTTRDRSHTGPPAVNVEVVLRGNKVESETSDPLEGELWARGPSILQRLDSETAKDGWVDLSKVARVQTNGTFIVPSDETLQ